MSKIKILSENLANQIAAGEVVERPASVVKELVENAIDAGAENIAVYVEGGGTRLIKVVDDGEGMDMDDVLLCLERHATSKLSSEAHLSAIGTLGFRGEAVPSIASVSRLVITSRQRNAPLGTRAEVKFGRVGKVHEMGSQPGTVMEISSLFGNVPARKKFLKTPQTEIAHIHEVITSYALAYHTLGFSYRVDKRTVFDLPKGAMSLEERVHALVGSSSTAPLIPIETEDTIRVHGYLLPPEESFGSKAKLRLFVNGRSVRDRMIIHAVNEGMHGFLMKGRRPAGVVFINIPPASVDVNVHPTKQEVRFQKPAAIHDIIVAAVRQAMSEYQKKLKDVVFSQPTSPGHEEQIKAKTVASSGPGKNQQQLLKAEMREPQATFQLKKTSGPGIRKQSEGLSAVPSETPANKVFSFPSNKAAAIPSADTDSNTGLHKVNRTQSLIAKEYSAERVRVIGQLMDSYILCEKDGGFIVIDQHAAHERIYFEMLKEQYAGEKLASQTLMFPKVIEYGPAEIHILERYQQEIAAMGIDIAEFGGGSYAVKAVPAILGHLSAEEIVDGVLEQFMGEERQGKSTPVRVENILATMACKAAVKANNALKTEEIEELLKKMQETPSFSHCPHGRPVIKQFSEYDIKKWFRRT